MSNTSREKAKKIIRLCKKEIIELNTDNQAIINLANNMTDPDEVDPDIKSQLIENNEEIDLLLSIIGDFNYLIGKEDMKE